MKFRIAQIEVPDDDPFKYDALKRQPLVEYIADLVGQIQAPFVMALDSPWGTGKSTIVRMLHCTLALKNFQCIYFNAWKVDYVTDPLVAMVSAIDDLQIDGAVPESSFRAHMGTVKKVTSVLAKRGLMAAAKAATLGVLDLEKDIEAVAGSMAGDIAGDVVDSFKREK